MHPGAVEFRTPSMPPPSQRRKSHGAPSSTATTPQDFVSPSTKRHVSVTSPVTFISPSVVNDDEAERRERRRSKVLELQRRHLNSPATPAEKTAPSAPLSGLNNTQLAEHYTNCIKLSTENKINAKNAFGLHLIDYMSDLLKKKEMTNFQVASSTLDASAKIYAGRVDAIHSETYKVLTGLGRGADKNNKDDGEMPENEDEDQDGPPGAKKRKRAKQGKTIEKNLRNINVHKLDLAFETDPLFHKTSAAFDEGGTAGLLLNHLHCRDDMSELILDSNTVITEHDDHAHGGDGDSTPAAKPGAIRDLKKMFLGLKLDTAHICPEFEDFEFTNWSSDRESGSGFTSLLKQAASSQHAFDLDAEAESIPDTLESSPAGDDDHGHGDYPDDGFGPLEGDGDDDDAGSHCGGDGPQNLSGQSFTLGDNKEAQMIQKTLKNIKHGTVGTLMQVLATEPSDYSYFNTNLLQTWAGPSHWKLRPKSKGELASSGLEPPKKPREKKEALVINYDDEDVNFDKKFKETKASTMLTRATLDKYSKAQNTLPEDLHYEEEKLFKLFSKPRVMIKRQKRKSTAPLDEQIENYDYDNANDVDNFCPAAGDEGDDDADNSGGFDFSVGMTQTQDTSHDDEGLTGDNLVSQPHKVAKIDIGYAKTAKKMDVKRLKTTIWGLLKSPGKPDSPVKDKSTTETQNDEEENKDAEPDTTSKEASQSEPKERDEAMDTADSVQGNHTFSEIVTDLPEKVSKNMARNLSVPIAFVCLLHLANEKTLDLKSTEDMTDIMINQG